MRSLLTTPRLALGATILLLTGIGIRLWFRDMGWQSRADETLPILVGIPLLFMLGGPWKLRSSPIALSEWRNRGDFPIGIALLLLGGMIEINTLMALGWTLLLRGTLAVLFPDSDLKLRDRLMPLAFLSFPWLAQDGQAIGWWFRLSGAWATEKVYALLGFSVERQGVELLVQGMRLSVDAPCAGLNVLQSLLLAGFALAFVQNGARRLSLEALFVLLVAMAWLANTLRIIMLCGVGLTWGAAFAQGSFHAIGGVATLALMFFCCAGVFSLLPATRVIETEN